MKITGYRSLTTVHNWGRPIGDVNGIVKSGITDVPVLLLTTSDGLTGVGLGAHADIERVFPAIEGEDPRAVSTLYDRMLAHVFKTGHAGATYGAIGAVDMALWDLKAKMRTSRYGGHSADAIVSCRAMPRACARVWTTSNW